MLICTAPKIVHEGRPNGEIINIVPREMSDQTRQAILYAALSEFAARGFDGASTRGIAARASLSHGLIRHYFQSKEKLWYEAVEHLLAQHEREVGVTVEQAERMAAGDRLEVRKFIRNYVYYCARHPEHARILYQESTENSERLNTITGHGGRADHKGVLQVITALINQGIMPKTAHPVSMMYSFVAACQNIFALAEECRLSLDYDVLTEDAIEAHVISVMDTFCPLK